MGVVMASCTQPAGSTVTAVTCAAKDGGRVEATASPAASLADEQRCPARRAVTGTVRSSRPGGRAGRHARAPARRRSAIAHVPPAVADHEPRHLLGHGDVHAVGPRDAARWRSGPRAAARCGPPRRPRRRRAAADGRPGPAGHHLQPPTRARCPSPSPSGRKYLLSDRYIKTDPTLNIDTPRQWKVLPKSLAADEIEQVLQGPPRAKDDRTVTSVGGARPGDSRGFLRWGTASF